MAYRRDTDTQALLETFLGHHLENIKKELCSEEPDDIWLTVVFYEVLDGVKAFCYHNRQEVLHFENGKECNCLQFISHHWPEVVSLEESISNFIGRAVLTDEKACWIQQMEDKYRLLNQLLVRQEQDYIDFVDAQQSVVDYRG